MSDILAATSISESLLFDTVLELQGFANTHTGTYRHTQNAGLKTAHNTVLMNFYPKKITGLTYDLFIIFFLKCIHK